ncbi:UspA domain-containing protein [Cyanobacterium stanieri PCC 7202]|uniref:UspA domain-containing protein n=1 Tax=Cyanobacterium stanieri (strain ATCC 29140 / PCC 7202) TaxID=292563 RepID=K9YJJ2_CYASC|nr:UspA domain-containing protein [Cyanobacterium stanieri PCC 7202]
MLQRCLICTDLKDGLHKLTRFVASFEHSGLKEITFLHSVPVWTEGEIPRIDYERIEEVKNFLSSQLENVPDTIKVNIEVISGDATPNIIETVEKYNIDFVILGTAVRTAIQEGLFGSTATKLTKKLKVPLMILRPQLISVYRDEELALRCKHLNRFWLVPYKGGKSSRYLIDKVKEYCQKETIKTRHQILLLTVVEEVSRSPILLENRLENAEKDLAVVEQELKDLGLEVQSLVKKGDPITEILDVALNYDVSAIAIADDRDNILLNWTVRSFGQEILHRSWFPLVYFPLEK